MGYKCVLTDMSAPTKGSLLTYQSLPPMDSMSLEEACTWFYNIWTTQHTILDMFRGAWLVMLFPEVSEYHLTYLALLPDELGPTLLRPDARPGAK